MALFRGFIEIETASFVLSVVFPHMQRRPLGKVTFEESFLYTMHIATLGKMVFEAG